MINARLLVLLAFVATPVFAQGQPKLPSKEEIEKKAAEFMAKSETATSELEGYAKITYKAIPSSAEEIAKLVGEEYKGQIPQGVDIDAALRQYGPQIQEAMNTYLTEPAGWKFEAFQDLKWKSKKIPKGEYKVSLIVEGEQLKSIILTQGDRATKKGFVEIPVHFKPDKKQEGTFPRLKLELKAATKVEKIKGDDGKPAEKHTEIPGSMDAGAELFRTKSTTTEPFKAATPPKKDEPKKDGAK